MQKLLKSRTFWLAIFQAIVGALIEFGTDAPSYVGLLLIAKSVVDVIIRFTATQTQE